MSFLKKLGKLAEKSVKQAAPLALASVGVPPGVTKSVLSAADTAVKASKGGGKAPAPLADLKPPSTPLASPASPWVIGGAIAAGVALLAVFSRRS